MTTNRQEESTDFKEKESFAAEIEAFKKKRKLIAVIKRILQVRINQLMHRFGQVNLRMDQPSATFNSGILTMTKCGYINYDKMWIYSGRSEYY